MSAHSMTSISGFSENNGDRLYYGFSSVVNFATTRIGLLSSMPQFLAEIGYSQDDIDELMKLAPMWKPVAHLEPAAIEIGQQAVRSLSRGLDIDSQSKLVIYGIREFATHCTRETQGGECGVDSDFILHTVRASGLLDEAVRYCIDEETENLAEFLRDRIRYPVYSRTAISLIYDRNPDDRGEEYVAMEARRVVAAAELVMTASHAIRNLKATTEFGGQFEGEVAERLEPLVRI
ncbi:hypothetical protein KC992_00125 [Candidatus Saccharibacteria bacterium]|nr:hypothetical protein [Candidatus Saccharibacteria bacterium]